MTITEPLAAPLPPPPPMGCSNGSIVPNLELGEGGVGGAGGAGGKGGRGGGWEGQEGEPGQPGLPGERGTVRYLGGPLSLTALITVVLACIGGIVWLVQMRGDIDSIRNNQIPRDTMISLRSDVDFMRNREGELVARLEKFDSGGTQALQVVRERVSALASELAGQNIRCNDLNRVVNELQRKTIEHDVQIQTLVPQPPAPRERR